VVVVVVGWGGYGLDVCGMCCWEGGWRWCMGWEGGGAGGGGMVAVVAVVAVAVVVVCGRIGGA